MISSLMNKLTANVTVVRYHTKALLYYVHRLHCTFSFARGPRRILMSSIVLGPRDRRVARLSRAWVGLYCSYGDWLGYSVYKCADSQYIVLKIGR